MDKILKFPNKSDYLPYLLKDENLEDESGEGGKDGEGDQGKQGGGDEGDGGLLWQVDIIQEAGLLPAEQAALLEKIARGMITEGHLEWGPKELKKMFEQEKQKILQQDNKNKQEKGGGLNVKTHPKLRKSSGLPARQISEQWNNQNDNAANASAKNKDKLTNKYKMSLQNSPKYTNQPKLSPKIEIRSTPKFNPKPPGM